MPHPPSRLTAKGCNYVIFHRHGHRAPARDILQDAVEWHKLLPRQEVLQDTNKRIQIINHNCPESEPPRDSRSHPFGALTEMGRNHLVAVGRRTRQTFPEMTNVHSIHAYSTNYHRTQLSGQSFLLGLLEGNSHTRDDSSFSYTVRKSDNCPMAFFDAHPKAELLLQAVRESEEFINNENTPKTTFLRELLLRTLPLLKKGDGSIDWLAAFDYVKCRPAHGLPLHPEIEGVKVDVISHVTSRYRMYYGSKALLGQAAAPLFADTLSKLASSSSKGGNNNTTIFSGHDVTLLALLHSLGARVLTEDTCYWPDFGSTLVFERLCGADDVSVFLDGSPLRMCVGGREVQRLTIAQMSELTDSLNSYSNGR